MVELFIVLTRVCKEIYDMDVANMDYVLSYDNKELRKKNNNLLLDPVTVLSTTLSIIPKVAVPVGNDAKRRAYMSTSSASGKQCIHRTLLECASWHV